MFHSIKHLVPFLLSPDSRLAKGRKVPNFVIPEDPHRNAYLSLRVHPCPVPPARSSGLRGENAAEFPQTLVSLGPVTCRTCIMPPRGSASLLPRAVCWEVLGTLWGEGARV